MQRLSPVLACLLAIFLHGCGGDRVGDVDLSRDLAVATPVDMAAPVAAPDPRDLAVRPPPAVPPPPYVPIDGGDTLGIVELISPAVCAWKNGRLVMCDFGQPAVAAPPTTEAPPWSTVVTTHRAGNCSSNYPLQLMLAADDDPEVYYDVYNPQRALTVRHPNRSQIATLHVRNATNWQKYAAYDASCRVWIEIAFNGHDPL